MGYMSLRKKNKRENFIFSASIIILTIITFLPMITNQDTALFADEFRLQYFLCSILLFLITLIKKRFKASLIYFFIALSNIAIIASCIDFFGSNSKLETTYQEYSFTLQKISDQNLNDKKEFLYNLKKQNSDFVLIANTSSDFSKDIIKNSNNHSFAKQVSCYKNRNCLILSKLNAKNFGEITLSDEQKALWVSFSDKNKNFTVILFNENNFHYKYSNKNLKKLVDFIKSKDEPVILSGGFASVPWSQRFKIFENDAKLISKSGLNPNWPSYLIWPLRLPLDHIYTHQGINISSIKLKKLSKFNALAVTGNFLIQK